MTGTMHSIETYETQQEGEFSGELSHPQPEGKWLKRFNDELDSLADLEPNWDSYGSQPPNALAIELARTVLRILNNINFVPTSLAPSPDEGVSISFLKGKKLAVIEYFNTGEIVAVTSTGDGSPRVWEVGVDKQALSEALEELNAFINS